MERHLVDVVIHGIVTSHACPCSPVPTIISLEYLTRVIPEQSPSMPLYHLTLTPHTRAGYELSVCTCEPRASQSQGTMEYQHDLKIRPTPHPLKLHLAYQNLVMNHPHSWMTLPPEKRTQQKQTFSHQTSLPLHQSSISRLVAKPQINNTPVPNLIYPANANHCSIYPSAFPKSR